MDSRDLHGHALRSIARYRSSGWHQAHSGSCRLTPTCSHYAEQVLHRRPLPLALLLIVARVLRCNPVLAPSRGVRRKALPVLALSALMTMLVSWTTAAVAAPVATLGSPITGGGCEAFIGGVPIGTLDRDHPLQVSKGQRVVVTGKAPTAARANPVNPKVPGTTTLRIELIAKVLHKDVDEDSTGVTFQKSVNVDSYLTYGSGVYELKVLSASPAWSCSATFFVELNGSALATMTAIAVGGIGVASVAGATFGGPPAAGDEGLAPPDITPEELDRWHAPEPDTGANLLDDFGFGCLIAAVAAMFGIVLSPMFAALPILGQGSRPGRVRVHGHSVLGFIGGLLSGLGFTVAGQQLGLWTFTIGTAIACPLLSAVLGALRARRGRAWKVA
jgi:hypothetical protein